MARSVLLSALLIGAALADEPWHNDNTKAVSKYATMADGAEEHRENKLKEVTEKVVHALDSAPIRYLKEHPEEVVKELEIAAAVVVSGVIAHEVMVHKEQLADVLEHMTRALRGSDAQPLVEAPALPSVSAAPTPAVSEAARPEMPSTTEADHNSDKAEGKAEVTVESHGKSHDQGHGHAHGHSRAYDHTPMTWGEYAHHVIDALLRPVNFIKMCFAAAAIYMFFALREHAHHKAEKHLRAQNSATSSNRAIVVPVTSASNEKELPKALAECRDEELKSLFREVMAVSSTPGASHVDRRRQASTGSTMA